MKTLVNKIFPHSLLCGPHEAEKHVPMFRNLHYKLSEFGAFFFGLFLSTFWRGHKGKKENVFLWLWSHLVCGKPKQIFLEGFIVWRLIRKILRVCNTNATCGRLFFKLHPKSAKWQLVWQSEDAMENVTNYTTSIAMYKTKSFQKEFQKKVLFQI